MTKSNSKKKNQKHEDDSLSLRIRSLEEEIAGKDAKIEAQKRQIETKDGEIRRLLESNKEMIRMEKTNRTLQSRILTLRVDLEDSQRRLRQVEEEKKDQAKDQADEKSEQNYEAVSLLLQDTKEKLLITERRLVGLEQANASLKKEKKGEKKGMMNDIRSVKTELGDTKASLKKKEEENKALTGELVQSDMNKRIFEAGSIGLAESRKELVNLSTVVMRLLSDLMANADSVISVSCMKETLEKMGQEADISKFVDNYFGILRSINTTPRFADCPCTMEEVLRGIEVIDIEPKYRDYLKVYLKKREEGIDDEKKE